MAAKPKEWKNIKTKKHAKQETAIPSLASMKRKMPTGRLLRPKTRDITTYPLTPSCMPPDAIKASSGHTLTCRADLSNEILLLTSLADANAAIQYDNATPARDVTELNTAPTHTHSRAPFHLKMSTRCPHLAILYQSKLSPSSQFQLASTRVRKSSGGMEFCQHE